MMEVFMDDFLVFGNSFGNCLSRVDKLFQRFEDTNLCLNWEKSHFMVKEGIVLGHKISKNGIEVDKAKLMGIEIHGPFPVSERDQYYSLWPTTCQNGLKQKRSPPMTPELFANFLNLSSPDSVPLVLS
ncbi:hypothetical protein Tco_0649717 [Tanacetum coccineum]